MGLNLKSLVKISICGSLASLYSNCLPLAAKAPPELLQQPLEIELLQPDATSNRPDVIRGDRLSAIRVQVPSLWWTKEQFDPFSGRLITNWLIYHQKQGLERRVDILVNAQLWGLLDYIERYTLVNKFGTAGREYAYNIRFFNNQSQLLAAYTCSIPTQKTVCTLWIEPSAQDSLRRRSRS